MEHTRLYYVVVKYSDAKTNTFGADTYEELVKLINKELAELKPGYVLQFDVVHTPSQVREGRGRF